MAAKRFYETVAVSPVDGGFAVTLDGRGIRTPGRRSLVLRSRPLAQRLADEWDAQEKEIRPDAMPFTRLANTAIDRMADERAEIERSVAAYGATDLLCYLAPNPRELTERQRAAWQPWLDWAAEHCGARLEHCMGLMPRQQSEEALMALSEAVAAMNDWELTALAECVALTGSLVLGLAILDDALGDEEAWYLSQLDEEHQASLWGLDAEAEATRRIKRQSLAEAVEFLRLSRDHG